MATATKKTTTKVAAKPAPKAAPVIEQDEAVEPGFGVADIAAIIKVQTGKDVKTRDLRTLLRKMARDGRLQREIVAGNRARWEWTGSDDPEVEAILEAYNNGELEADKQEKLNALKERKASQRAEAKAAAEAEAGDDEELEEE